MPFILTYELAGDKKLWTVASGDSLDELKAHIDKYALGTTFFVYEVPEDFNTTSRLAPPVKHLEPVFTWCDGGSSSDIAFLQIPVDYNPQGGKAKLEFTLSCESLPEGAHATVGLFDAEGGFMGRTEIVSKTSSPVFQKQFIVSANPKDVLDLKFSVYDAANGVSVATFLGCCSVPFKALLNAPETKVPLLDNGGAETIAQLCITKKARPKKEAPAKKDKKDKKKKGSKKKGGDKPGKPSEAEMKQKAALKEGGKKGQDIAGLSDMGGVSFFHVAMDVPEGDMALLNSCLEGFNREVEPDADDRKGGAGNLGKMLFSYDDEKLIFLCHVPEEQAEKVTPQEWVDVLSEELGGVEILDSSPTIIRGKVAGDPDGGQYPIKMRDAAITKCYDWLVSKQLVLADDDSDDEVAFGDDDFPDY